MALLRFRPFYIRACWKSQFACKTSTVGQVTGTQTSRTQVRLACCVDGTDFWGQSDTDD